MDEVKILELPGTREFFKDIVSPPNTRDRFVD